MMVSLDTYVCTFSCIHTVKYATRKFSHVTLNFNIIFSKILLPRITRKRTYFWRGHLLLVFLLLVNPMFKKFTVAAWGLTAASAMSTAWMTKNSTLVGLGVETVDELDVNAYVGTWYQMYADQLVYSTIEPNAYCVTAKYGLLDDGSISVHNYQTTGSPSEGVDTIDGTATVPNPEEPGQLSVSFDSVDNGAGAPYWVLGLGPINANGYYDWSIVSDPFTAYLFVLARDVETFNAKYDADVKEILVSLGFTKKFNSPIATYQEDDCVYEA